VARLIRSPTVNCKPSESIGVVAERMTAAGANSAIVELDGGAIGIITDRDLRTECWPPGVRVAPGSTRP